MDAGLLDARRECGLEELTDNRSYCKNTAQNIIRGVITRDFKEMLEEYVASGQGGPCRGDFKSSEAQRLGIPKARRHSDYRSSYFTVCRLRIGLRCTGGHCHSALQRVRRQHICKRAASCTARRDTPAQGHQMT